MAALVCDICGGTLAMDASGEFAICDSCGMKHTKERVKAKVQEIQGVVEVTKGEAEKERLLKNAETFINLGELFKAKDIYESLTNDYPDDYRGWYGLAKMDMTNAMKELMQTEPLLHLGNASINKSGIAGTLQHLYYLSTRIQKLEISAYQEIINFEKQFISTYNQRGLTTVNQISFDLFHAPEKVENCSATIQEWVNKLLADYFADFEVNKEIGVVWCELGYGKQYPAVVQFFERGKAIASKINQLPIRTRQHLLRVWGVNDIERVLPERYGSIAFVLGYTVLINGYECTNITRINIALTEANIDTEIRKSLNVDMSNICERCGNKINPIGFCVSCGHCNRDKQDKLCNDLLEMCNSCLDKQGLFNELRNVFDSKSYVSRDPWKNPNDRRSYRFSKASMTGITLAYHDVEKGINLTGLRKSDGNIGSVNYSQDKFCHVYMYMIKRKGRCQHCGSSFSGVFNKKCSSCGRPKDY